MRLLLFAPILVLSLAAPAFVAPALADPCGEAISRVAAATGAQPAARNTDFARFEAGPDTGLTLSCGPPSSVGAQFAGEAPPDRYFALFGKAGEAAIKVPAQTLETAARQAREAAVSARHSHVDLPGLRVTCAVMASPEKGPRTLCAAIEQADR